TTSVGEALEAALALVAEDAEALGCAAALAPARAIVLEGAGADLQRAAFRAAQRSGADERESLRAVVDALAEATAG
ncbi:MAG: carboxylate--amine ligase, partial [Beijerinckiaceae bacterium]|nr:carboxylate--amine ligase [Beijerinckiaceae bacterium]